LIRFTRLAALNHSHIATIHLPEHCDGINFLIFISGLRVDFNVGEMIFK
jgi:hypothetical protein